MDIILIPSIESHYYNFLPLLNNFENNKLIYSMLYIKSVIADNRDFDICSENKFVTVLENRKDAINFFDRKGTIKAVVVGNDSEPEMVHILKYFKNNKTKIVLLQDGWLVAKNIKKPIYNHNSISNSIKKQLHRILVSKHSPFKYNFHNFIGQNSDYFFVYSSIAKQEFIKAKVKSSNIFETGSPRFKTFRTLPLGDQPAVLFFNTYVSGDVVKNKAILKSIDTVVRFSKEIYGNEVQIILKCHPRDNGSAYLNISNITIHNGDIVSLITLYKPVFAFCFNSTVIFELMVQNIPFIQLMPHPFSEKDYNYQLNLPYLKNLKSIKKKYIEALNFDYLSNGKELLLDVDCNFNSVAEIHHTLNQL